MNNNYIVLLVALICGVLLLSVPSGWTGLWDAGLSGRGDGVEGFMTYYNYFKTYCPSVSWRGQESCAKCQNGGWATRGDHGECVFGDSEGPWYSNDYDSYTYSDTNVFYPNSSVYPVSLVKSFFPKAQTSVKKPYKWNKLPYYPVK